MSLSAFMKSIPDPRRGQGQRYPLESILWIIFLGTSCGYVGYRSIAKFGKSNGAYFESIFGLKHGLPSHVTIRQVLSDIDKEALKKSFQTWCSSQELSQLDWLSGDGKSLKSTLQDYYEGSQDFCSIVSLYVQKTGLTYAITDYRNKKVSEPQMLRELLPALQDKGVIITLDAIHTQKKQ
jgi:DDE_Tnp_1-associated